MVRISALIFITLTSVYALNPEIASKLKSELAAGNIIPQVFRDFEPKLELKIQYKNTAIENGMEISEEQSNQLPLVSFELVSPEKKYTLIMFDADTRLYHWVVKDIHGVENDGTAARTRIPYKQTVPNHRYVFAVFEQTRDDQKMELGDYFDITQLTEKNNLELNSALYIKQQRQRSKKRQEQASELGEFLDGLAGNMMGVLKQFGVEFSTKSASYNVFDQGKAFASSFNSMKSAHDKKQDDDNSNLFHTKKALPTAEDQVKHQGAKKKDVNPARAVESMINMVFQDIQSHVSASPVATAPANAQVEKKKNEDPMKAVESMISKAFQDIQSQAYINQNAVPTPSAQIQVTKKKEGNPAKAVESMIDRAFRNLQSQVSVNQAAVPTSSAQDIKKEDSPAKAVESMISRVFQDIQDHASVNQVSPQKTRVNSAQAATPSIKHKNNMPSKNDKKSDPWFFDGFHNMIGSITDFRKNLSDKLKKNVLIDEDPEFNPSP